MPDVTFQVVHLNNAEDATQDLLNFNMEINFAPGVPEEFKDFFWAVATYDFSPDTPEHLLPTKEDRSVLNRVFYDIEEVFEVFPDNFEIVSAVLVNPPAQGGSVPGNLLMISKMDLPQK